MEAKTKFVYHYPTFHNPKPEIKFVQAPTKKYRRMDNIAETIRKFNPRLYSPPVQDNCPYCGSTLPRGHHENTDRQRHSPRVHGDGM